MDLSTRRIRKNAHDGVDKKKPHLLFCCGAMMAARFRSQMHVEMRKPQTPWKVCGFLEQNS